MWVVQLAERWPPKPYVEGSIPSPRANTETEFQSFINFYETTRLMLFVSSLIIGTEFKLLIYG